MDCAFDGRGDADPDSLIGPIQKHSTFSFLLALCLSLGPGLAGGGCSGPDPASAADELPPLLRPVDYDTVYTEDQVDRPPELEGRLLEATRHMEYPDLARENNITGRVVVQFVISPEGEPTNIRMASSVHPLLDNEARRTALRLSFTPARIDGEPVPVYMKLPLTFNWEDQGGTSNAEN